MICYCYMESPFGQILVAGRKGELQSVCLPRDGSAQLPGPSWKLDPAPFREVVRQMEAYFSGRLRAFDLALAPEGTHFQKKVWTELREIPYGGTVSYGEIARRIGHPRAVRAVGAANGANPLPIVMPCHRVIGSDGRLTGYGATLRIYVEGYRTEFDLPVRMILEPLPQASMQLLDLEERTGRQHATVIT